jgi:hypothetical protein
MYEQFKIFRKPYTYARYLKFFSDEIAVLPTGFEDYIVKLFDGELTDSDKDFILDFKKQINELHDFFEKMYYYVNSKSVESCKEVVKEKLLELALLTIENSMFPNKLYQSIYPTLLENPYRVDFTALYFEYLEMIRKLKKSKTEFNSQNSTILKASKPKTSPFRSKYKQEVYFNDHEFTLTDKVNSNAQTKNINFNLQKTQQYMLKSLALPKTFQLDYVFFGNFYYLLAINVNTRKAYVANGSKMMIKDNKILNTDKVKSNVYETVNELKQIMQQTTIKALIMDKEPSFISHVFQKFLSDNNIAFKYEENYKINDTQTYKSHTTLAVLNRFCRTLRTMLHNLGYNQEDCNPNIMQQLIKDYNSSPHTTLSNYFGKPISPDHVNKYLEEYMVVDNIHYNQDILNSQGYNDMVPGVKIKVYNPERKFNKLAQKTLAGDWFVDSKNNNKFNVKNKETNALITVPRFYMDYDI